MFPQKSMCRVLAPSPGSPAGVDSKMMQDSAAVPTFFGTLGPLCQVLWSLFSTNVALQLLPDPPKAINNTSVPALPYAHLSWQNIFWCSPTGAKF